jgi:predicted transposase/invertase (TIGR01784 family)
MTGKLIFKHDKLFKKSMEIPAVRREFFEMNLEEDIKPLVNFDTLKLEKETFVSEELKNSSSDILFSVKFDDKDGYLSLLK